MTLGHDWRPDGVFLVKWECMGCHETQESLALSSFRQFCDACERVNEWMRAAADKTEER